MTESTQTVECPCPQVVVPTADELEKAIIAIGNQYGWEYIKPIEDILGSFPLSHSWNKEFDVPELEWEGKIQCMIEEFKLFPIIKIAEFVGPDGILVVPIPVIGISVDCGRLISDPSYKIEILKQLEELGDEVIDLFLDNHTLEAFDGTLGIDIPDIKLSLAWKQIVETCKKLILSGGMSEITALLGKSPLKEIIDELPHPVDFLVGLCKDIPAGKFEIDMDEIYELVKAKAEAEGISIQEALLNYPFPIPIAIPSILGLDEIIPETVGDLINLIETEEVKEIDMPNWNVEKLFQRFKTFMSDLPQILFEAVMKVCLDMFSLFKDVFNKLIPEQLRNLIPLTLCSFLTLIGFPKQINVVETVIESA